MPAGNTGNTFPHPTKAGENVFLNVCLKLGTSNSSLDYTITTHINIFLGETLRRVFDKSLFLLYDSKLLSNLKPVAILLPYCTSSLCFLLVMSTAHSVFLSSSFWVTFDYCYQIIFINHSF